MRIPESSGLEYITRACPTIIPSIPSYLQPQSFEVTHSTPFTMVAAPYSLLNSLSAYESLDETTHIGTRFPNKSTQLSQFLTAQNSDELITDLASLVSHRGVVFFTAQDLTLEQQRELGDRLGQLSGRPATSKLHRHPISENTSELGAETSVISSMG